MSRYEFNVTDYKIIKEANFSPEGVTLIYGGNGNGKSTIIKALVSFLNNRHTEDNFHHGKDSYKISARINDNRLTYTRTGAVSQVQYNDEFPRSKLGQGPMSAVEPRFPLKRVDYVDDSFFPNFVFQNAVPVFDDISVEGLFSAMFSDMARLSERVTGCRNDCVNTARVKNDSQVNSDMLKEKVSEAGKRVAKIRDENPDLEERYSYLKGLVKKQEEMVRFKAEFDDLSAKCPDLGKRGMVSLYNEALPLFSNLTFVKNMQGVLAQLDKIQKDLVEVKIEVGPLVELFPDNLVFLVDSVRQVSTVQASLTSIHIEKEGLPDFSYGLVSSGASLMSLNRTLEGLEIELREIPVVSDTLLSEVQDMVKLELDLHRVRSEIESISMSYDEVISELKQFPCDRFADGLCPFQDRIAFEV